MNTPRFLSLFVQGNPSLLHHSFLLEKGGHTCLVSGKRFLVGGCVFIRWLYADTIPQLGSEALFLRSLADRLIDLFDELIRHLFGSEQSQNGNVGQFVSEFYDRGNVGSKVYPLIRCIQQGA